jgi:hypothetical protein
MYYFLPKAANRRSTATASRSSTSGRWSSSTSGPARTTCSTPLPHWLQLARHALQPDALGALLGRHAQRPAHPARRLEQAAHRPGDQVLRRRGHLLRDVDLRRPAALDQGGQRSSPTTPTGPSATCTRALGWNGFMAAGMFYWLAPRMWKTKLWSQAWPTCTSGSAWSASSSTSPRCGFPASCRA